MREIKFRALNFGGVWYYSDNSSLSEFFMLVDHKNSTPVIRTSTISQFTGMRDRNGKEIYEGDQIYKYESIESSTWGYFIIKWHGAGFGLFSQGRYQGWLGKKIAKNSEVRKNIYENPDILGGRE